MSIDWIKKRWFLVTATAACVSVLLGGAAWATKQDVNTVANTQAIKEVKDSITKRLDRIESKLDRLIERK
jgi:hypothetical protein